MIGPRLAIAALVFAGVAGCSGSSSEDAASEEQVSSLALNEGRRAAAIYRTWQQVMGVLLVTLRSPDDWSTNDSATLGCSGGGTVAVTFTPGTPPVGDRVVYTFESCVEGLGQIDGQFDGELVDDRRATQGFWRASWDADLMISGSSLRLDGGDTRTLTNDVSGDYTVSARLTPSSSLTAPTGESFSLASSATTNTLEFTFDVSGGTGEWDGTALNFNSAGSPDSNLRTQGPAAAAVTQGIGAHTIGVPNSGEMLYRRLVTPEQPDIVVDILSTSGLADINVRAAGSFGADATQQTWDDLLAEANFDTDGLRGQ